MTGDSTVVEVMVASLDRLSAGDTARLIASCSPDEQRFSARLPTPLHRTRSLLARGLLRELLGRHVGLRPAEVGLQRDPLGKLHLPASIEIGFNVSHSRDLAVYAVGRQRDVGIDVEARDDDLDIEAIARRFFPPPEAAELRALSPPDQRRAFFRSWSRKEALLKAQGQGLRGSLHQLPTQSPRVPLRNPSPFPTQRGWSVIDLDVAPGFEAAVVTTGIDWTAKVSMYQPGTQPGYRTKTPSMYQTGTPGSPSFDGAHESRQGNGEVDV